MTEVLALAVEAHLHEPVVVRVTQVGDHRVTLVAAPLDRLASRLQSLAPLLAEDERDRAGSMRVLAAAARWAAGRAVLRAVLGAAMGRAPAELRLASGDHGKPELADARSRATPGFNVAHAGDLVVVALTDRIRVGVDVERARPLPHLDRLVLRGLTPGERELFAGWCAEGLDREAAFLRAWTVKEARIKALGLPIGAALSRDDARVSALPWAFAPVADDAGYVCAVAVASS